MTTFFQPLKNTVRDYANWAQSDHPRVATGFPIFDSRTQGGIAQGEVLMFMARSSVGKTAVACNMIISAQVPTMFFSLEMHGRYIAKRLAAINAGVPDEGVEFELRTTGRSEAFEQLVSDFPHLCIVDKPAMTLKEMAVAMGEATEEWGEPPKLVVIDYLELIGGVPSMSAPEAVDKVARKIKDFAREWDCALIVLHQVGRGEGGAGAEPLSLTASRYGGETQADYVMGAYRPCLRLGITQAEYDVERWTIFFQFLKTRGGSSIHPGGDIHFFDVNSLRIQATWPEEPLFGGRA